MKRIGFLVLALVLIMGTMGIAYAKWTDTVSLTANITTDNLEVCITPEGLDGPFSSDRCGSGTLDANALGSSCDPMVIGQGQADPPKDVACMDIEAIDCHTLDITVTNAYPFYAAAGDFTICSTGSVPVKICSVTITYLNADGKPVSQTFCISSVVALDLNNDNCCDTLFRFGDNFGDQLEGLTCADESFAITFLECLPQTTTLHFTLTLNVVQWNEFESACGCDPLGDEG